MGATRRQKKPNLIEMKKMFVVCKMLKHSDSDRNLRQKINLTFAQNIQYGRHLPL